MPRGHRAHRRADLRCAAHIARGETGASGSDRRVGRLASVDVFARMFERASVDVTVRGQGEETFAEIVERLAQGRSLDDCAGCTVRLPDGTIQENPRAAAWRKSTTSGRTTMD